MSSPVVNKDTVFIYKSGSFFHLCFLHGPHGDTYGEGKSLDMRHGDYWSWTGKIPSGIAPIGQRCILQW